VKLGEHQPKEVAGALVGVAPVSGLARVLSATLEVALVVGYDIDQAFDTSNGDERWCLGQAGVAYASLPKADAPAEGWVSRATSTPDS